MDLQELKRLIDYAIDDCQWIINQNPQAVLSEGDFERLLSDCISKRIGYSVVSPNSNGFAVFSQITHYNNESNRRNARVDILLAKPIDIKEDYSLNKRYKIYKSKESFAIELKYRHDDNRGCVTAAKGDIDKFNKYKDESYYYSIILLDQNKKTNIHKKEILDYYENVKTRLGRDYYERFFCKVLINEKKD